MEKELQELKELHRFYLYHDYKTGEIAKELNKVKMYMELDTINLKITF